MSSSITYVGPCKVNCPQGCTVPAGAKLTVLPRPRHNWPGLIHCPHEECQLTFSVDEIPAQD